MNRLKSFGFWAAVGVVVVVTIAAIRGATMLVKKVVTVPPTVDQFIP